MEEVKEQNEKSSKKIMTILSILIIFILLIIIISLISFVFLRIIPTDFFKEASEPGIVFDNTKGKLTSTKASFMSYEEFYNEVDGHEEESKISLEVVYDLTKVQPELNSDFYNIEDEYYDYCQTKKVNIDFTKTKKSNFTFNYNNNKFNYEINLYEDLYKFSQELKTQDCYFRKDQYVMGFLKDPYNKNFMEAVSNDFLDLKSNYSEDEIAEIATVFVQSIKYGSDKTKLNRYAYETLYEEQGNCLDKSVILAEILKKLGYKTYIILGNTKQYHALIGVVCEKGNLVYNNEQICFAETTIFSPIGNNIEINIDKFVLISDGELIYKGKNYGPDLVSDINQTYKKIDLKENEIASASKELSEIQQEMCKTDCVICEEGIVNFQKSNQLIKYCYDAKEYNDLVKEYKALIDEYNQKINDWYAFYYEVEKKMFGNVKIVER